MPKMQITLIKGDKKSSKIDYLDILPVNMYAVKRPILNADGYLLSYPGLTEFGQVIGNDRGAIYNETFKAHFRVSGNKFISVDKEGGYEELGTISGDDQASLVDFYSLYSQGLVVDGSFYTYNPDLDPAFYELVSGEYFIDGIWIDGYYFLSTGDKLWHTVLDADDPENAERLIDPDSFSSSDFSPDPIVGLGKTEDNKIIVFGRYSIEYFINEGTDVFKFRRVEGRALKLGIVATHAKCELDGKFYITGSRKNESLAVYVFELGDVSKISTRSIDDILAKYSDTDLKDLKMEVRAENDISFVIIHLPEETVCFNKEVAREFGFEEAWFILRTGNDYYRAINGIYDPRINKYVYGDRVENKLGVLNNEQTTHYGKKAEWTLYSPLITLEPYSVDELEIEIVSGFDISEEFVEVSITTDGITYGEPFWNSYGKNKEYTKRFILRRLGVCNKFIGFRLRGKAVSRVAFALMSITYS